MMQDASFTLRRARSVFAKLTILWVVTGPVFAWKAWP